MIGYLIGNRTGAVCDIWHGSEDELFERFNYEGHGYTLRVYDGDPSLDGSEVCEFRLD
jgi:hypothetical protein